MQGKHIATALLAALFLLLAFVFWMGLTGRDDGQRNKGAVPPSPPAQSLAPAAGGPSGRDGASRGRPPGAATIDRGRSAV